MLKLFPEKIQAVGGGDVGGGAYLKSIVSLVKQEMNLLWRIGTLSDRIEGN